MTERYSTPDGLLTLLVQRDEDDVTIGFEGYPWHTHADIIADLHGHDDPESALQNYLDDLFHDRLPIVVWKKAGVLTDALVPDFPDEPIGQEHCDSDESFEVRLWSGFSP